MFVNPKSNHAEGVVAAPSAARLSARGAAVSAHSPRSVITGTNLFSFPELWTKQDIILDASALDYATLTTRKGDAFHWAVGLLTLYTSSEVKSAQNMQYKGIAGDGWFAGRAEQKDHTLGIFTPHYMIELKGSIAHRFFDVAMGDKSTRYLSDFKATRLDVQYTSPTALPDGCRLSELSPLLEAAEWPARPGPRPAIRSIWNSDGRDTLYIGTRGSRRYTRIYMKPVGGQILPRFEVEYRAELAANLWEKLLVEDTAILAAILAGEVASIPLETVAPELYALLTFSTGEQLRIKIRRTQTTVERRLLWLYRTALPAVQKLKASPDEHVRAEANKFLKYAASLEAAEVPEPGLFDYEFFLAP